MIYLLERNTLVQNLNLQKRNKTMKIKPSKYINDNPPINDKAWQYHKYNDLLARFKAMGWTPPSERARK